MSQFEILNIIEKLRTQLYEVAKHKPLIAPEVVEVSQKLDSYLNLYQRTITC